MRSTSFEFSCKKSLHFVFGLFTALSLVNCNYKSPATETPIPTDEGIEKSFFVESKVDPKTGKMVEVPKTFLCGWLSEMETGEWSEFLYTNNAIVPEHCNVAFEITQDALVAKQVNPSFPDDPKRWEIAMSIPIKAHYYWEHEKDSQGRDTNKIIKNTSRSHWSARTHMELNFSSISFTNLWNEWKPSYVSAENVNVESIEWDKTNSYLSFVINRQIKGSNYNKVRFGFKSFEHDKTFIKTPFNDKNYKKMNVLHIVGEKSQGLYQILHAAHWDLRKTHEIRLWNVPDQWKPLVKEVVQDWNDTFKKIGATEKDTFVVSDEPAKSSFDLRYSTIAWVSDEKISSYSPLGIGMALADVKNGEIKSGMVTIYAGGIEKYVKAFSINNLSSFNGKGNRAESFNFLDQIPLTLSEPTNLANTFYAPDRNFQVNINLSETNKKGAQSTTMQATPSMKEHIAANLPKVLRNQFERTRGQVDSQFYKSMIRNSVFKKQLAGSKSADDSSVYSEKALKDKAKFQSRPYQCTERTFEDIGSAWMVAKNSLPATTDRDEKALRTVIKELLSHEFGHFLGLGHQFKENIIPAKGTVPDSIYNKLTEKALKKNMTNYTSVMGYRSPVTEILEQDNILPGPQDELVLRYLYKQEYPTYTAGAADFTYTKVPESGIVPEKASYFPQCNDIEASISMDPFCNRFDRGYSASTIAKSYFDDIYNTQIQSLFSFSDNKKLDADEYEYYLWRRSFKILGRLRLFYDYMRLYYKTDIDEIRRKEENLYEFSESCDQVDVTNPDLRKIFSEKPQLKELCQANKLILKEFKELVAKNVTDFTKKDFQNRFTPGGMSGGDVTRDWSQFSGSWTEMTGVPFKIGALFTLTTGVPYASDFGMMNVPLYDDPNYKYSYASLFPKEFVEIMTANMKGNLHFGALDNSDRTKMGVSISSMGWFQYLFQQSHNDFNLLPEKYADRLKRLNELKLSAVAIIMKGKAKDNSQNDMERFETSVLDFDTNKEFPAVGYFLPGGKIIASAPGMFIYPISPFFPYSNTEGYAIAYKLDFIPDHTDPLDSFGPKTELKTLNDRLINSCLTGMNGVNNGLRYFFNPSVPEFKGIKMPDGIAFSNDKKLEFIRSIEEAYKAYYNYQGFAEKPKPETCEETLRGISLIISSAAIMNGYWLPEASAFIQK